jgi:Ca-activated chloride channel family protein
MSWAHPFVLGLVPAALLAAWWTFRRARAADGHGFANIRQLWADRRGLSDQLAARPRRARRGVFLAAGAAAALLALARPQWGEIAEQTFDQSREVMLALDLSRSMLADDVAPTRLARAKLLISALLDELAGERVGLIVFAGTSFVQSPLSADYEVLRDFLDELEPSYLPQGGTDYERMLRTAAQAFGEQGAGDRYLVVLSDGEALDPNWKALAPSLRARGIRVIGLGVGTPAGALVPDGTGGLVKDEHGGAVLSRLEPGTLQELAAETGGTYRDAATWVDIAALVHATVEQGRRGDYVEERNVRLQDRYQRFLGAAVLFLLLSYWLEFPLSPLARALPSRGRRPHPASAPAIAAALLALAAWQTPRLASAAVSDTPPWPSPSGTASQPNPLTATVAELSAQPALAPADYARMASATIAFARDPQAPHNGARTAVIDDALAAVDRGEAADARAADWPALRQQLEQLKQVQPQPPPQDQQAGTAGDRPADDQDAARSEKRQDEQQAGASEYSGRRKRGRSTPRAGLAGQDDKPVDQNETRSGRSGRGRARRGAPEDAHGRRRPRPGERRAARRYGPGPGARHHGAREGRRRAGGPLRPHEPRRRPAARRAERKELVNRDGPQAQPEKSKDLLSATSTAMGAYSSLRTEVGTL